MLTFASPTPRIFLATPCLLQVGQRTKQRVTSDYVRVSFPEYEQSRSTNTRAQQENPPTSLMPKVLRSSKPL